MRDQKYIFQIQKIKTRIAKKTTEIDFNGGLDICFFSSGNGGDRNALAGQLKASIKIIPVRNRF